MRNLGINSTGRKIESRNGDTVGSKAIIWMYGTNNIWNHYHLPFSISQVNNLPPFPFDFNKFQSVQFSPSVMSDSLQPHGLQHTKPPCPSPTPGVYSNSCPLSQGCHPTISSSAVPFSSCLQSFPASGPFPVRQFFTSGGHSIRVSASTSVLPMNIQDWFPLGWTGWISLQPKELLGVFYNTTVWKQVGLIFLY